jgi:hypothetical protein
MSIALYDTITAPAGPGQARCAPLSGILSIAIPSLTPNGTSTTVMFQVEPVGLPWMAVTRTTTVTASTTSDVAPVELPRRLALSTGSRGVDGTIGLDLALPHGGPVRLEAFDVAGRRRATLLDGSLEAGWTRVPWTGVDDSGRRLAAGVYLLRLVSPDGTASGRVVLTPG